ncbi:unnamed protein product [Camellia sinensis]
MTIADFFNHVQIVIQTRGYDEWQNGEANLLVTRGLVGRLSNTPNVGFAYEVQGVTDFLTSKGVKAIAGEKLGKAGNVVFGKVGAAGIVGNGGNVA